MEAASAHLREIPDVLPRGLAGLFGGSPSDYKVASFRAASCAVFFPSWLSRESAIGRSPLRFEDTQFSLSDWVEVGELARGRLLHKAWIRLVNWPILCWNEADIKEVVSGFGELWETDARSCELRDVSHYKICIRCQNVNSIPEALNLTVEDRRFRIPILIDSWEETNPILLGENLDHRLGLDSMEEQEDFIRLTGFNSIPVADPLLHPRASLVTEHGSSQWASQIIPTASWRLSDSDFPSLQSPAFSCSPCQPRSAVSSALVDPPPRSLASLLGDPPVSSGRQAPGIDSGPLPVPSGVQAESSGAADGPSGLPEEWCLSLIKAPCLDLPALGSLLAHRLSPRLATKYKGIRKSSLVRAQDLKCKKLKMVRFASQGHRPSSSPTTSASTPVGVGTSSPSHSGSPSSPASPTIPCPVDVSSPRSDHLTPLTLADSKLIKAACGIIDTGSLPPSSLAPPFSCGSSSSVVPSVGT